MKNFSLLVLCSLFATVVLGQQKIEFGPLMKAGNFTLPKQGPGPQPSGNTYSKNTLSGGFVAGAGVYTKFDFAPRWGLTSELLYSIATFTLREEYNYDPQFEQYMLFNSAWALKYTEQSLTLPVKIHLHLDASAKTVLALGIAPSFNLRTAQRATFQLMKEEISSFGPYQNKSAELAKPSPRTQCLLTTSLHRYLGKYTSVGIELLASFRSNDLDIYFTNYENRTDSERSPFYMKSLSVSLRHNILR